MYLAHIFNFVLARVVQHSCHIHLHCDAHIHNLQPPLPYPTHTRHTRHTRHTSTHTRHKLRLSPFVVCSALTGVSTLHNGAVIAKWQVELQRCAGRCQQVSFWQLLFMLVEQTTATQLSCRQTQQHTCATIFPRGMSCKGCFILDSFSVEVVLCLQNRSEQRKNRGS